MSAVAELSAVSHHFGGQRAVNNLSLAIPRGGVYALLGANGAGKTTTIALLLGLLRVQSGDIRVLGGRPGEMAVRRATGAMLQVSGVPDMLSVREHIELFSGYYPQPLPMDRVVEMAALEGLERRRFGKLSGGQKQRVLFALAICGNPQLLFLDEPTVGMDVEMRRRMWRVVRDIADEGRTVVLTTHYLEEADALADRIGVLHAGRLVAEGTPEQIKATTGGRLVRCSTVLDDAALRTLPGVRDIRRQGDRVEIAASEVERMLRALLARDTTVGDLTVAEIGLDDAFLSLTNEAAEAA
ncbi:MAG TPA: ABC transporter ATP-binding protein [Xanthomonadaceae bacterium]|nr:ABC transporter ATP-binding protein [Xanthomonadaceae bacterium]